MNSDRFYEELNEATTEIQVLLVGAKFIFRNTKKEYKDAYK